MKTKIRLMALVAGFIAVLPLTSAWASTTHSTHNGSVSVAKTGEGTVYLSTANNATSGETAASWNCGGSSSNDSKTFYLYAQPAAGWSFSGWSGSGTSQNNPYQVSLNAQNGSHSFTATFTKQVQLSFQATENGTYSATDGTSSIASTSEAKNLSTAKSVTLTAKPSAGYTVKTWWYQETGADRVDLGNNLSYTHTFKADAVVGVEFMVKGDTVLNKTTGVCYRSLDAAVAAVAAGEELELIDNDELAADVTVPADVRFVIPAAKSYIVPSGRTLTVGGTVIVSGTLTVDGAVDGAGSLVKSLKVITQTGMGVNGQEPYVPYEKMKYFKTTVSTETGTVGGSGVTSCAQSPFVKIVRYNGVCSYHALGASTTVVYCSVDLAVANNCIKDFVANYDTLVAAFDGKASSAGWANAYKLGGVAILLANGTISKDSSTNIASSLAVDCAGKTLSVSAKQINNTAVILAFNASSASMPKLTSGGAWFVNCDSCKVSEVNVNSDYQSNVRYFDCGKTSAPGYTVTNGDGNGGMFFFAGEYWTYAYTVTFKSYYRVYSGLFKNDPTSNLAENDLEVVKEGTYYRVRKQAPKVLTVQVGEQQYETLQEAVNAANGGKITLLQDIELTADLTVAAGQTCTIELAGFDISGFSIMNHGTLTIEDSSNFDTYGLVSAAITNDGTLKIVYGEYTGAFTSVGGTFTLQGGVYRSSLSGACFDIRSGKFTSDVSARLNDRRIISSGGFYWVGPEIHAGKTPATLANTEIAFDFTPLDPASDLTLYRKYLTDGFNRSQYSDAEWYRLSELYYSLEPIISCTTECTLCFDRDVEANTITGYGKVDGYTKSDSISTNHPAHALYWTTIPTLWSYDKRPISYNRFLSGDVNPPTAGVKNNSNKNIGTTCTIAFQYGIAKENCWIRDSAGARMYIDWDFYPLVSHDYKFTGGSNKAMINYVLKDTLQTAVNQVEDQGTIMLANDDDETVIVSREVSFTLETNNFTFTGEIKADEANGFYIKRNGAVWTVFKKATAAPVEIKADGGTAGAAKVEVEKAWAEKVAETRGAVTDEEKQAAVKEALNETAENGLKVWENKVLEQAEARQTTARTGFAAVNKTEVELGADTSAPKTVTATAVEETFEGSLNPADLETGVYQETIIVPDANGDEVAIANTDKPAVSVVKNDSPEKTVVLAIPGKVTVDKAIATTPQEGDQIKVYDVEQNGYRCWNYTGSTWEPIQTVVAQGGTVQNETPASNQVLSAGSVILYEHKEAKAGQKVSVSAAYTKDIVSEPLEVSADTTGGDPKWNLMANPTAKDFELDKIVETDENKTAPLDKIVVLKKSGLGQTTYEKGPNQKWGYYKMVVEQKNGKTFSRRKWVDSDEEKLVVPKGQSRMPLT